MPAQGEPRPQLPIYSPAFSVLRGQLKPHLPDVFSSYWLLFQSNMGSVIHCLQHRRQDIGGKEEAGLNAKTQTEAVCLHRRTRGLQRKEGFAGNASLQGSCDGHWGSERNPSVDFAALRQSSS